MVEPLCIVVVAVVGSHVEVHNNLNPNLCLLEEDVENVLLEKNIANLFEPLKIKPSAEVVETRVFIGSMFASMTET